MSYHSNGPALIPLFGLGFGGGADATSMAMGYGGAVPGSGSGMHAAGMGAAGGTFAGGAGGHRPQTPHGDMPAMPKGGATMPSVSIQPAMKGLEAPTMPSAMGGAFGMPGTGRGA